MQQRCARRCVGTGVVAALVLGTAGEAFAQGTQPPFLPTGGRRLYTSSSVTTPHCNQKYRLYLPPAAEYTQPAGGWPVLIHFDVSGFVSTIDYPQLDPDPSVSVGGQHKRHEFLTLALQNGIAVVTATSTISEQALATPKQSCTAGSGEIDDLPGDGIFWPPAWDIGGGVIPWDDPNHAMGEKDALMLVQHVRHGASQSTGLLSVLDPDRIVVHGSSAGAISMMRPSFSAGVGSQAPAGWTDQDSTWSRPDAAVLRIGSVWFPGHVGSTTSNAHWAVDGMPTVGSTTLSQVNDQVLIESSAAAYEDHCANDELPLYMHYNAPFQTQRFHKNLPPAVGDCTTEPQCTTTGCFFAEDDEVDKHSSWNGFAWKKLHPALTRLGLTPAIAAQAPASMTVAEVSTQSVAHDADILNWLVEVLEALGSGGSLAVPDETWTSPWTDLGVGLVGGMGDLPDLAGVGRLAGSSGSDTTFTITLANVKPDPDGVWVVVSPAVLNAPFQGGVVVPDYTHAQAVFLNVMQGSDGDDGWGWCQLVWPGTLSAGATLYWQAWILEDQATDTWAASNALMSVSQ